MHTSQYIPRHHSGGAIDPVTGMLNVDPLPLTQFNLHNGSIYTLSRLQLVRLLYVVRLLYLLLP